MYYLANLSQLVRRSDLQIVIIGFFEAFLLVRLNVNYFFTIQFREDKYLLDLRVVPRCSSSTLKIEIILPPYLSTTQIQSLRRLLILEVLLKGLLFLLLFLLFGTEPVFCHRLFSSCFIFYTTHDSASCANKMSENKKCLITHRTQRIPQRETTAFGKQQRLFYFVSRS